jgi:hypothetical protein
VKCKANTNYFDSAPIRDLRVASSDLTSFSTGLTEHKLRGGRLGAELLAQFHLTRPELLPHQLFQELIAPFSPVDPNLLTWAEFHHGAAQLMEKGPAKLHILGSFDQFDVDGDGEISTDDLKVALPPSAPFHFGSILTSIYHTYINPFHRSIPSRVDVRLLWIALVSL